MLDDHYPGAEPKLDEHQMSELEAYLEEHIFPDAKSVIAHIYQQYVVHYSVSGVTDLLHRLGFSYKKPTHVPGKQDPVKQQAFLEEYEQTQSKQKSKRPNLFRRCHPSAAQQHSFLWLD